MGRKGRRPHRSTQAILSRVDPASDEVERSVTEAVESRVVDSRRPHRTSAALTAVRDSSRSPTLARNDGLFLAAAVIPVSVEPARLLWSMGLEWATVVTMVGASALAFGFGYRISSWLDQPAAHSSKR